MASINTAVTFIDKNMLQRVRDTMINRANDCSEERGHLFENH